MNSPLILGSDTDPAGLTLPVTGPGGLAGLTLLGVDGPAVQVHLSPDGAAWTPVTYPVTLQAGTQLRLIRTDTSPVATIIRATFPDPAPTPGGAFTVTPDVDGFLVFEEALTTTDPDGYLTITNATSTPDADGYLTVERSS